MVVKRGSWEARKQSKESIGVFTELGCDVECGAHFGPGLAPLPHPFRKRTYNLQRSIIFGTMAGVLGTL
jgi:hypothetical protein